MFLLMVSSNFRNLLYRLSVLLLMLWPTQAQNLHQQTEDTDLMCLELLQMFQ
jgi:hypothetical protein